MPTAMGSFGSTTHCAKLWGAILLLLFGAGQVASVAHLATVQHERCPLDGELAHGGHHEHDGAGAPMAVGAGGAGGGHAGSPVYRATEHGADHAEHCAAVLASEERGARLDGPGRLAGRVTAPTSTSRLDRTPRPRTRVPVYAFAPKQSPPPAA